MAMTEATTDLGLSAAAQRDTQRRLWIILEAHSPKKFVL